MPEQSVGAAILTGPQRVSVPEQLVDRAVRASALDLIAMLQRQGIAPIVVAGPDLDWIPARYEVVRDYDRGAFHYGGRLAGLIERYDLSPVLYFGAGSTPLLPPEVVEMLRGMLAQSEFGSGGRIPPHIALTNNLHSSDWIGLSRASDALPVIRRAERDNSLAWMLQEDGGYSVRGLAGVQPVSTLDLDTPADLAIVRQHPNCAAELAVVLNDPLLERVPVDAVIDVTARDGSRVALIGRVAPRAWQALSSVTQAWIRAFSEERGMVASERLARGEVHSLVGRLLDLLGPVEFFAELARVADAAIIDSRVMMAAAGHYPGAADRFASDLFMSDQIADDWLRAFTAAAQSASIPVLLGGHGVVAGGLYALADIVAERRKAD